MLRAMMDSRTREAIYLKNVFLEAAQARRADLKKRLAGITQEIDNLTAAIAAGGDLAVLVQAVKDRQAPAGHDDAGTGGARSGRASD